jgi:hypothetical protein
MKTREKNLSEQSDKKAFKKSYIVRKYEEKERDREIKEFIEEDNRQKDSAGSDTRVD